MNIEQTATLITQLRNKLQYDQLEPDLEFLYGTQLKETLKQVPLSLRKELWELVPDIPPP